MDKKRGRKRWLWIVLGVISLLSLVRFTVLVPRDVDIIIGYHTTRMDGPVNADGTVNYVAWLNQHYGEGVTKENNAVIPLVQAVGRENLQRDDNILAFMTSREKDLLDMFGQTVRVLALLDVPPSPEGTKHFVELDDYVDALGTRKAAALITGGAGKSHKDLKFHCYLRRCELREKPWSPKEEPLFAGWLKENEGALSLVAAAARRTRYYVPFVSGNDPPTMVPLAPPFLSKFRRAIEALSARAMLRLHEGDGDAAWSDVLVGLRLARLGSQLPTTHGRMISMGVEARETTAIIRLATSGKLTGSQARKCLRDLQALPPRADLMESLGLADRACVLDQVMVCKREGLAKGLRAMGVVDWPLGSPSLDWNEMLRILNQWRDRLLENLEKPYAERIKAMEEFSERVKRISDGASPTTIRFKAILMQIGGTPFRAGLTRALTNRLLPHLLPLNVDRALVLQEMEETRSALARLSFALAAFKAERGRFPAALDELKDEYVKDVPLDLFVDKPLIYRRTDKGYVLYSVGENMTDDGGVEDGETEKDDIAVRVE